MQIPADLRPVWRTLLTERLANEELKILCFDMGIDDQQLPGATKGELVVALLQHVERRQLVAALVLALRTLRPDIQLPLPAEGSKGVRSEPAQVTVQPVADPTRPRSADLPLSSGAPSRAAARAPEMVRVPAGPFRMGITERQAQVLVERIMRGGYNIEDSPASRANLRRQLLEVAAREIELPEYHIGMYPLTNAEFAQFTEQSAYVTEAEQRRDPHNWRMYAGPGKERHPVVFISWYDAQAYCDWLRRMTGASYGLPTVEEWTKAASGTTGRLYPWGDSYDPARCNTAESMAGFETTEVGLFPSGQSEYGAYDLVGNVYEWTSTSAGAYKLVMGGSWKMACEIYGLTIMGMNTAPLQASDQIGFRCVRRSSAPADT